MRELGDGRVCLDPGMLLECHSLCRTPFPPQQTRGASSARSAQAPGRGAQVRGTGRRHWAQVPGLWAWVQRTGARDAGVGRRCQSTGVQALGAGVRAPGAGAGVRGAGAGDQARVRGAGAGARGTGAGTRLLRMPRSARTPAESPAGGKQLLNNHGSAGKCSCRCHPGPLRPPGHKHKPFKARAPGSLAWGPGMSAETPRRAAPRNGVRSPRPRPLTAQAHATLGAGTGETPPPPESQPCPEGTRGPGLRRSRCLSFVSGFYLRARLRRPAGACGQLTSI